MIYLWLDGTLPAAGYAHIMLNYARQRAAEAHKLHPSAVLVTNGPAGLQAGAFSCEAVGILLYLLVPQTSDHLFNLEHSLCVTLLTDGWELYGKARILSPGEADPNLNLTQVPVAEWCVLVSIEPTQIKILRKGGWGSIETIDLK